MPSKPRQPANVEDVSKGPPAKLKQPAKPKATGKSKAKGRGKGKEGEVIA